MEPYVLGTAIFFGAILVLAILVGILNYFDNRKGPGPGYE